MIKIKITKKEVKSFAAFSQKKLIKLSYCKLQDLLSFCQPQYYSAGINGWDCDYYEFEKFIICTGYRPIGEDVNPAALEKIEEEESLFLFDFWKNCDYEAAKKEAKRLLSILAEETI